MTDDVKEVPVNAIDARYARLRLMNPERIGEIRRSLERHGQLTPLVVHISSTGSDAPWTLVDGYKRHAVLSEVPTRMVLVRVIQMTEVGALGSMMTFNRGSSGLSALEEGWIVQELVREHKLPQKEVASLLGRATSWVCRRLQLVEALSALVQEDIRLGLLSPSVARELVRLPHGNQAEVADAIRRHGLTVRQSGVLVRLVEQSPDAGALRDLLRDPLRWLARVDAAAPLRKRDATLSDGGDAIRVALLGFEQAATRTAQSIARHAPTGLASHDRARLGNAVGRARERGAEAIEQILSLGSFDEHA